MKTLTGDHWTLYVADCREAMAAMPERSVHCVVSSPPYWGLRDYGIPPVDWADGERCVFGLETTFAAYIRHTVEIFEGLRRVLRDDGVIWWNVGDSFITGAGKAKVAGGGKQGERFAGPSSQANRMPQSGIPSGSKGLIPHRVAIALQDAGWCVRQDNVWSKRSPMPESVSGWRWMRCSVKLQSQRRPTEAGKYAAGSGNVRLRPGSGGVTGVMPDEYQTKWAPCEGCDKCRPNGGYVLRRGSWRTTNSHEYVFMVTKGGEYFSDGDAVVEPVADATRSGSGNKAKRWGNNETTVRANGSGTIERQSGIPWANCETRNPRSVWTLSNEPFKGAHFACFPTAIPRRCIEASTSKAGCCPACGSQYAPIVETSRVATRPGNDTKVGRVSDKPDSPYNGHNGPVVGNRDPQRHCTVTKVQGYLPTCTCNAGDPIPATVLDIFNGSGTTGQVARHLGRRYIGCEINETYARELAAVRIETPLVERKATKAKRRKALKSQQNLFAEGAH